MLLRDKAAGLSTGFVPTMGALHEGHTSLIQIALSNNDRVVCSIFVNPTQFNDAGDLARYPRMPEKDLEMLDKAGCHYVFMPSVDEMYPHGQQTLHLELGEIAHVMEGKFRPGHFDGVATIVDTLFTMVPADAAYFGEKDFQQLAIIRKMARLRNHSIKIVGCPTLREPDGLAMSSRNLLLTPEVRKAAPLIYSALKKAAEFIPHHSVAAVKDLVIRYIEQSPLLAVQYFEFVDPETLEVATSWNRLTELRGCIAVLTRDSSGNGPRLIDNMAYRITA
jgi:pantoate--beta-alanine ligase